MALASQSPQEVFLLLQVIPFNLFITWSISWPFTREEIAFKLSLQPLVNFTLYILLSLISKFILLEHVLFAYKFYAYCTPIFLFYELYQIIYNAM